MRCKHPKIPRRTKRQKEKTSNLNIIIFESNTDRTPYGQEPIPFMYYYKKKAPPGPQKEKGSSYWYSILPRGFVYELLPFTVLGNPVVEGVSTDDFILKRNLSTTFELGSGPVLYTKTKEVRKGS